MYATAFCAQYQNCRTFGAFPTGALQSSLVGDVIPRMSTIQKVKDERIRIKHEKKTFCEKLGTICKKIYL